MAGPDRAARLSALEERYLDLALKPAGRTMADVFTEHGFTEAEIQRAADWLGLTVQASSGIAQHGNRPTCRPSPPAFSLKSMNLKRHLRRMRNLFGRHGSQGNGK